MRVLLGLFNESFQKERCLFISGIDEGAREPSAAVSVGELPNPHELGLIKPCGGDISRLHSCEKSHQKTALIESNRGVNCLNLHYAMT